uniref:Uncharacterized protein n=1 Tax=Geladintestivirus 2 TaxID=3233134 RepID=A0AAU8MLM7_9CAUD
MNTIKQQLGKVSVTVEKEYYNSSKCYDKLVIVEDLTTKCSYISRKPVPSGVQLNDRNYWIKLGGGISDNTLNNINVLMSSLSDKINQLQKEVDELKELNYLLLNK